MDNYFGYKNLLESSINAYESKVSDANSKFQSGLMEVQGVKRLIEQTTQPIGDLFLAGPLKDVAKGVIKKAAGFLTDKINPAPQTAETVSKDVEMKTINTEEGGPGGDLPEGDPLEELSDFKAPVNPFAGNTDLPAGMDSEAIELFGRPKGVGDATEWLNKAATEAKAPPAAAQTEEQVELNERSSLEQTAKTAQTDAENAAKAKTSGDGEGEGGEGDGEEALDGEEAVDDTLATTDAVDATVETALLADPFTALFGLILGIGTIVGGIEGAESHKNPSIPKIPPIANVATQFGVGN